MPVAETNKLWVKKTRHHTAWTSSAIYHCACPQGARYGWTLLKEIWRLPMNGSTDGQTLLSPTTRWSMTLLFSHLVSTFLDISGQTSTGSELARGTVLWIKPTGTKHLTPPAAVVLKDKLWVTLWTTALWHGSPAVWRLYVTPTTMLSDGLACMAYDNKKNRVQKKPDFFKPTHWVFGFVGFWASLGLLDFSIWTSSWEACWLI